MLMTERYTVIGTGPSTDIDIEIEIEIDTAQAQCRVLLPTRQQPNVLAGKGVAKSVPTDFRPP